MSKQVIKDLLPEFFIELMEKHPEVVLVDADLSRSIGTFPVQERFPDRCIDVGIAEANMLCMAAGMASYGLIPFTTSFTAFATRRICDQITISAAYAKNNVKILGADAGLTAELTGGTHMSVEDISVLRAIPGLVIVDAVDATQFKQILAAAVEYQGPMYIRTSRKAVTDIFGPSYEFDLMKADILMAGSDVTIFASSIEVEYALEAAKALAREDISAEVINVHTIKPLDEATILTSAKKTGAVVTAENSSVIGGLGAALAELFAKHNPMPMEMIGIQDRFGQVGYLPFLLEEYKMRPEDIVAAAKRAIARKKA